MTIGDEKVVASAATAPPSAPVGVDLREAAAALLKAFDDSEHPFIAAGAAERVRTALAQQPAAVDEKYAELIYAVANKYPGESRHETALRYIRQAESADHGDAQAATQPRGSDNDQGFQQMQPNT